METLTLQFNEPNLNSNYKVPAYEYKSPYNPGQIQRPTSSRDRNLIQNSNNSNPIQINLLTKPKFIIEHPEHKVLIHPIKIIENPKRIPSTNHINSYNVQNMNNLHNPNNFLKGTRLPTSDNNKIIHNVQARPINLYRK